MTDPKFIHLRCHSAYSLLEGAITVKNLVGLCTEANMPAVAIADTANLFGSLEFSLTCAKEGVQPIIACQMQVAFEKRKNENDAPILDATVLIAKDETGYHNLLKLVSKSFIETPDAETPHITFDDLQGRAEGLICMTGGYQGWLGRLVLQRRPEDAEKALLELKKVFGDRLYMELSRLGLDQERQTEPVFLDLAFRHDVPLVATNEVFFEDESMHQAHDALMAVAEGAYVTQTDRRKVSPNNRFRSPDEMVKLFHDLPEAVENTLVIAKRCSYMPGIVDPILPPFASESGRAEPEELAAQGLVGLKRRLENQVYTKDMDQAQKDEIFKTYNDRLEHELKIINKMGYPGYFLIVSDFIKWAKDQNIPVGPGRGSGAGSIVAWALTITDIDPIRFNLLFERFLNPERVSMPDFDVDFCQERRDEVINYVQDKYGKDKVAQIITFGKLQARAVLRDVGRVLQMPYNQVDRISKLVPNNPANPMTLAEALEAEPKLKEMRDAEEDVAALMSMAMKLEGLYRHASTHAAGVVIGDRSLDELVPLYRDPKSTMPVTQLNMKYVEQAGLVKFDFLGLKTLTVISKACEILKARGGPDVDISKIPFDDKPTFDLLKRVETTGVFQLESAGMRDVLRKQQPDMFEEIIALVALYRPGPMDDIPRYLACKHGEEEITYPHPMVEDILKETFGVMVYQEQVMQIAQVMGGYSLGAADLLRRAMGKKIKSEMDNQREIFVKGAMAKDVDKQTANMVFDQMAKFAGYGFNKSHSAPYGLLAYQTAYLKANYPVDLFAAIMTLDVTNTDKLAIYKQELVQMKIKLLPPDINASEPLFKVEKDGDELCVRYALSALKNVGESAMQSIVDERNANGPYKDLMDFICRLPARSMNKRQFENLIFAGAFDSIHPNRAQIFENLDNLLKLATSEAEKRESAQGQLFGGDDAEMPTMALTQTRDWPTLGKLQKEFEAVGFYLSSHPLDAYTDMLGPLKLKKSYEIQEAPDGNIKLAGIVTAKQERVAKSGNRFAFVQFSDSAGAFEATFFSELLADSAELLESGAPLLVTINKRMDGDLVRLTAQSVKTLDKELSGFSTNMKLHLEHVGVLHELKDILDHDNSGTCAVDVTLATADGKMVSLHLGKKYALNANTRSQIRSLSGVKVG